MGPGILQRPNFRPGQLSKPDQNANVLPLRHRGGASYVKFNKLNQNKYIHTFVFIFLLMLLFLMKTISNISDTRIRRENDAVSENNA